MDKETLVLILVLRVVVPVVLTDHQQRGGGNIKEEAECLSCAVETEASAPLLEGAFGVTSNCRRVSPPVVCRALLSVPSVFHHSVTTCWRVR